jgi:hypothetical protein
MPDANCPAYRPVVVAPTHRNARTLAIVLGQLDVLTLPVIVVNDGSDDETAEILSTWATTGGRAQRFVETHAQNLGKAAALETGFHRARAGEFTHALTIDTDLQHDVDDVPALLEVSRAHPAALVIGVRPIETAGYPLASRIGRRISNLLVRIESGVRIADSQCGLRVYPLELLVHLHVTAGRFGYETEIVTRAGWAGLEIRQTPIRCIYDVPQGRVTHFRPVLDSIRAFGMHMRLIGRSLLPWPPRKVRTGSPHTGTLVERMTRWFNPAVVWQDIRQGRGDGRFPASVAAGMFMAVIPLYGLKTVICLAMAKILRLQPLVVLAVSSLTTPPVGPLLAVLSVVTGHLLLHHELPRWPRLDMPRHVSWNALGVVAWEWMLGSVVCGTVLAALAYYGARWFVRIASRDGNLKSDPPRAAASATSPATEQVVFRPHN